MIIKTHNPIVLDPAMEDPRQAERDAAKAALRPLPVMPAPESPSLPVKAMRLARHLKTWVQAGAQMTPLRVAAARLKACNACEYWQAKGNLGLGECRAPGCGCTRAKVLLATSTCPHPLGSRWTVLRASEEPAQKAPV